MLGFFKLKTQNYTNEVMCAPKQTQPEGNNQEKPCLGFNIFPRPWKRVTITLATTSIAATNRKTSSSHDKQGDCIFALKS